MTYTYQYIDSFENNECIDSTQAPILTYCISSLGINRGQNSLTHIVMIANTIL